MDGNVVSDTDRKPRPAGLNFHSALQRERRHLNCTVHIHPGPGVVVSAWEEGLQFFDQGSCGVYGQVEATDGSNIATKRRQINMYAALRREPLCRQVQDGPGRFKA
jgi:ribulose-5-phosphate 4-epimerase/fuculose-1-phosphate aldolase